MRKVCKRQAEEFMELLSSAHEQIKKEIKSKNNVAAMELLEQCQEGAITLGNLIEKYEGEHFVTIPLLEDYCELIYQIHEQIGGSKLIAPDIIDINLHKQLIKIENSIKNDIKTCMEVVFLPYKASMWDSLESIYKAVEMDEECNAYVIPIPYFDKGPDGSFQEMHYEGDMYPTDIKITDYNSYNLAKRHPDMIFIHNPYDEYNIITSVHPFFYSKNLKQYTDQLIYVPYFVLEEVKPDNQEGVESMKHFCTVPGVINADRVVVQSDDMRQNYINVLVQAMGQNTRKYWEDKIVGLGSPKIDKVLNAQKEDINVPEEWMKIIRKVDGSWKKIILYNTSVAALLQHSEQMLEKMDEVFGIFKENKDEVALLWRPHPLIKATIESTRPQLWVKYLKLLETYRSEGWGIYDDSADMDRAVTISDAYYGDWSSIVQLYKELEKPILIQQL